MKNLFKKLFGGLNITWPKLIIFGIIMGIYTGLMALLLPDGNSFHDIAVTGEWWVLPAMIIIINSKKPLDAALKTFVFFLISQPIVYLVQVPFNYMGWGLFGYYPYWFGITLLTFPAAFVCWYIKKDKWYSGLILAIVTTYLAVVGVNRFHLMLESPLNHLVTIIYCFLMIPILLFATLKDKIPRIITVAITIVAILIYIPFVTVEPFETYNNSFLEENSITLVGEPYISFWAGEGKGNVEIIKYEGGYNFKLTGLYGKNYYFDITDDEQEYHFRYYYDNNLETIVVEKTE
ncbi:hypothetical protein IKF30_01845 [Candidatus Saccharibacteria bacterium]|nr:hypothetical protein [Candidatus Saccharibacteria bacterium]